MGPQSRAAWKGAFPRVPEGDVNAMINGVAEARKWLSRMHRNQKTGDRTHPIICLMLALFGGNSSPKGQGRRSTSPNKGQAGTSSSPKGPGPSLVVERRESQEDSQASSLQRQGSLRRLNTKMCPIIVAQAAEAADPEVVNVTSTASSKSVVPVEVLLHKKPAMAKKAAKAKQPAKGKNKVLKKPAASLKKAADSLKKVWHETVSHGRVKVTKASEKAYITYKASDGKEKSLVNVRLRKGDKQSRVMDMLLEQLQTEQVDRDSLLKFKESLLSREKEGEPAKAEEARGEGEPAMAEAEEEGEEKESLQKAKG